jgi:ketosteroid isomerase-like protein
MEASTAPRPAGVDGPEDAAGFVERFEREWGRSDADALAALLTEDVVLMQPMMPRTVGREASRRAFARLFRLIPDLHVEVRDWAARADVVLIEFTLSGSFGGRELSWPAVDRIRLRDGLVAERISYFDALPLAIEMLKRPRGWRRMLASGFRPSFRSMDVPSRGARR